MKKNLFIPLIFVCLNGVAQTPGKLVPDTTSWYKVSSTNNLLHEKHLFSKSLSTSVAPNLHYLGLGSIIAPPYFCYPFEINLEIFKIKIPVKKYDWYPSETILQGESVKGIGSQLKITPLALNRGIIANLELTNNSENEIIIPVDWIIKGKVGSSKNWEWYPPFAMQTKEGDTKTRLENSTLLLINDTVSVIFKSFGIETITRKDSLSSLLKLGPKEKKSFGIAIVLGSDKANLFKIANNICANPAETLSNTRKNWEESFAATESKAPGLEGASKELIAFYKKGLITFLTCRWDVPEFTINPWYAESGLDGGAINNYFWGLAYISRLMSVIEPTAIKELLLAYVRADLAKAYALNPSNGKGMGVLYSYNYYSIARATYDYVVTTGDIGILSEKINDETYLDYIYRFCLLREDLEKDPELINYGDNHNLLELKRTNNYTCYTPSPNAERLLTYRYLTELFQWVNKPIPHDLESRGKKLKIIFREKLWDTGNNWLYSLDKKGQKMTAYSIQIFDVLRTQILTKNQEKGLVSHLKEKEFLSQWGVHSLAITDQGYDPTDVDWGGPGVYAGDAPELIEDLINSGYTNEGINLLQRILWWGELPYFPQAIRADKKGYREDGRPNVIAGLATTQCIIFGLFGITVDEKSISIKPVNHPVLYGVSLNGLNLRGIKINIAIAADGKNFNVQYGNKSESQKLNDKLTIKL